VRCLRVSDEEIRKIKINKHIQQIKVAVIERNPKSNLS